MANTADSFLVKPLGPPRNRQQGQWVRRALIFATVVVLVDGLVGQGGLAQAFRASQVYDDASAELREIRHENARLAERARRLGYDRVAIEAVAREDLGMVRRDEIVFIVNTVDESRPEAGPRPAGIASGDPDSH